MPGALAKVHPLFKTPYVAISAYASIGFILAVSGGFRQLATIASAGMLIIYLGVVLATIRLGKIQTATAKTFHLPGGMIVPLLAAAGILGLLSKLTRAELIGIAAFILMFSIIYLLIRLIKRKKVVVTGTGI